MIKRFFRRLFGIKTRRKFLLELLRYYFARTRKYDWNLGICVAIDRLFCKAEVIDSKDKHYLLDYIRENRPSETLHSDFYRHKNYIKSNDSAYWWVHYSNEKELVEISNDERLRFLDYLINIQ